MAFMYNSWVIPLRSAFKYQTSENVHKWMIFDYLSDFIYLIDLIFIKPRVMYLEDGFWIKDSKLMRIMYFRKSQFKVLVDKRCGAGTLLLNNYVIIIPA